MSSTATDVAYEEQFGCSHQEEDKYVVANIEVMERVFPSSITSSTNQNATMAPATMARATPATLLTPKLAAPLLLPAAEAEAEAELELAGLEAPELVEERETVTPKPLDEEAGAVDDAEPEPELETEFETVSVPEAEPEEAADVEEVEPVVAGFGPM
jgi:hypothetical protein